MNAIWKYPFDVTDHVIVKVPAQSKVLCVQMQGGRPCIWVLVDPSSARTESLHLRVIGTGHQHVLIDGERYIGTVQDGQFVWHVFHGVGVE